MRPHPFQTTRAAFALAHFLNAEVQADAFFVVTCSRGNADAESARYAVAYQAYDGPNGVGGTLRTYTLDACAVQDARDRGFEFPPCDLAPNAMTGGQCFQAH